MFRCGLVTLLSILLSSAQVQAEGPVEAGDCAAMLEQVRKSYESVSAYDLLLTYTIHEEGNGVSFTTKRASRIAQDPRRKRLSITTFTERKDNLAHEIKTRAVAVLIDSDLRQYTEFMAPPAELPNRKFDFYLDIADVANVFMIGATLFPDATHDQKKVDEMWQAVTGTVATYGTTDIEKKKIACDVVSPLKPQGFRTRWQFVFDPATALPIRHSCSYLIEDGERSRYHSSIAWCEPSVGVYLPESLQINEAGRTQNAQGEAVETSRSSTVELKWLSVNAEVEPDLWDTQRLDDVTYAMKSVELD